LWAALAAWLVVWTWARWSPSAISWHYFEDGVHWMFVTDHLHVFAHHPELQLGPLTLLLVAPFTLLSGRAGPIGVQLFGTALGLLVLYLAMRAAGPKVPRWLVGVTGAFLMPAWTVLSVRWLHPDDVFAVVFAVGALVAVRKQRGLLAGFLLGAAVAAKPWALGFEPVLLMLPRDKILKGIAMAAGVVAAAWLPFVLADPGTLAALHPAIGFSDTSVLRLFGVTGSQMPAWVRPVQLLGAPVLAYLVVRRGRWQGALLVAFALRLVIDPHDIGYYEGSAVAFAVVADLAARMPLWTPLTAAMLWHPFVADFAHRDQLATPLGRFWFDHAHLVAGVHLTWAAAVIGWYLRPRSSKEIDRAVPSPSERAAAVLTPHPPLGPGEPTT
jgi:hypothetical protein